MRHTIIHENGTHRGLDTWLITGESVLLDCDGVLADFGTSLLEAVGLEGITAADIDEWDIFSIIEREAGIQARHKAFGVLEDPHFWAGMRLMPGAQELVQMLKAFQCDIHVVTSPWVACAGWDKARREWLCAAFSLRHDRLIITEAKSKVVGDVFIDDKIEHVRAWEEAHPYSIAVLMDAPYNRNEDGEWRLTYE
jgi:5'(3')-deoxyribonucleotidase